MASSTAPDPELARLLMHELQRHLVTLEAAPRDRAAAQRSVHALKGSAGLAGERELAAALERLHRRVKDDDESAFDEAAAVVRTAVQRLGAGESAIAAHWPVPPDDLAGRQLDPLVRAQYAAEVTDRLARIDEALSTIGDPVEAASAVYRHVHSMKGAASAVGDEAMSWFCHGLEEKLKGADSRDAAVAAAQEAARWRVVLGALLDDPETALATLRARRRPSQLPRSSMPSLSSGRPLDSDPPRSTAFEEAATATIRVPAVDVDRLLERFDAIDLMREGIAARAVRSRQTAVALRELRGSLMEALRLIGPPRPWGAPAAALQRVERVMGTLGAFGEELDAASARLLATEHALRDDVAEAKKQLSTMRQTSVGRIFARLTTAIESEARRSGRTVIVRTRGADEMVDRRIAEQLVEPCLQLVRNAVAHGIEPPEVRVAQGKPAGGTIALTARRLGHRLSLTIGDDGAGVDVADVRARALEAGLVTQAIAEAADDDTLLSLLFVPGFSTRESSDLLAGRGIGLEIARSVTQRMGGAIRLSSRAGEGFSARIDVPIESGLVNVLWVSAGKDEFAMLAVNVRRVRLADEQDAERVPHLSACLDAGASARPAYVLELEMQGDDAPAPSVAVGVDAVGGTEELLVRPLGPLVGGLGPFAGAIVRGDGSLRLAIDAWAIAPRARAFTAARHPGGSGHPPPSRPPSRR
ncbi:MAG TPA: Hpt domain-containing protein [Polyangiaceae bacterium]|jgi:two-component system chemotaxis sensor kinase CheA